MTTTGNELGRAAHIVVATVLAGALADIAVAFFEPQRTLYDERITEAPPLTVPPTTAPIEGGLPPASPPIAPMTGSFRGLEHEAAGTAAVLDTGNGRVLRLTDFRVENGPDLFVYLSEGAAGATDGAAYNDNFVSLGQLKGNVGDQNYAVPPGTDLSRFSNVVIWCKRFGTGFAAAPLSAGASSPVGAQLPERRSTEG